MDTGSVGINLSALDLSWATRKTPSLETRRWTGFKNLRICFIFRFTPHAEEQISSGLFRTGRVCYHDEYLPTHTIGNNFWLEKYGTTRFHRAKKTKETPTGTSQSSLTHPMRGQFPQRELNRFIRQQHQPYRNLGMALTSLGRCPKEYSRRGWKTSGQQFAAHRPRRGNQMSTELITPGFAHELTDEELAAVHGGLMKHEKGPFLPGPCGDINCRMAFCKHCLSG